MSVIVVGDRAVGKTRMFYCLADTVEQERVLVKDVPNPIIKDMLEPTEWMESDKPIKMEVDLPISREIQVQWSDIPGEAFTQRAWRQDNRPAWESIKTKMSQSRYLILLLPPHQEIIKPSLIQLDPQQRTLDEFPTREFWQWRIQEWLGFLDRECPKVKHLLICLHQADLVCDNLEEEANRWRYQINGYNWNDYSHKVYNTYFSGTNSIIAQYQKQHRGQLIHFFITSIKERALLELPWIYISTYVRSKKVEEEGEDSIYEAKLLIVGEASAGKTTLANKIRNPQYQLQANEKYTEGIDVIKWSFLLDNKREFKVNIWDFGGQEIYHTTHQFFLTKRSLYALVVDTRKEDTDFDYWLNVVELLSENSPLLIIKNEKQDRIREINERALRGQFTNLKETLVTNLATNRGLDEIISNIQDYIKKLPHVGQTLPKTWVKVRQALENNPRNYISFQEYLDICEDHGFKLLEDKLELSGYLHDLGVCLHFQDQEDSLLYKTVILKPEWGTSAVYTVLDNRQVINNQGHFTRNNLKNIWQEEKYASMRGELLELMKKFQLCYEIPDRKDTFIAPQLLSENQPEYYWDESNNLILSYSYPDFMPKGIITRYIVSMHQYIDQQKYVWKTGVILSKNNSKAEVIEYYGKREIRIRVVGNHKKNFMTIVTHELDKINNSYKRLNYKKLIPCNCSECKNQQEPYFHSFDVLQKAKQRGQREVQCQISFQMIDVLKLIDDVIIPYDQLETIPKSKKKMKTIKIFLASSSELKADREQFEIFINRKNNEYVEEGIFLKLVLWEDFLDAMSPTRLQDEYNKAVADCDVFVSLFYTKVGKYTAEEFEKAFKTFKDSNKPLIYTYFKDAAISTSKITPEIMSLLNFKQKLSDLGHFYTNYKDINDLKYKFSNQLTRFLPKLTGISYSKIQQHNIQESQPAPQIVQNFHGDVGVAMGNVEGNQNVNNIKNKGNRNIKIGQGNYNANIEGNYIDQHRTQNISGGTINASGAGAFSLGDNYGTVANTINQTPDFDNPSKNQLKQLLIQLQNTVNQENLDNDTKSDFLDEIKVILDALPNSQNDSTKKQANKSMRALKRIADDLPSNSATVNLCKQLPDLIAQVF